MLSSDENENKPIGKVQRKAKTEGGKKAAEPTKKAEPGKKAEPRKRKDVQPAAAKPDQLLDALQRLAAQDDDAVIAPAPEEIPAPALPTEPAVAETPLPELSPIVASAPVDITPVSLQTIANAYGDYSKKSLEQTSSFVASLAGARSLDKAFELQTAFARQAYETFVAETKRIRELHTELAKQRLNRLEGFVGMTKPR